MEKMSFSYPPIEGFTMQLSMRIFYNKLLSHSKEVIMKMELFFLYACILSLLCLTLHA